MINKVKVNIENIKHELIELSEYILNNPELGHEEIKACKAHIDILRKHGFKVEEEYLGIKTAFRAEFSSEKEGATIAYLSEYDALPEIGHGCGHNLLGTTSTGAGIVLSKIISQTGGKVVVLGTPAEETCGGKVDMVDKGAFANIDVAMIAHPADANFKSGPSLAMEAIQFTYRGRTAHAAAQPEKGINALDAAINTFNNINSLRQHIRRDARIHGIIKEGGQAANVVPDLAIAQFYVRASKKAYLKELVEKVKNCARGASLAAGTELEITNYETSYDNMITNETLSELFTGKQIEMGVKDIRTPKNSYGSLDTGNVSHVCPCIHPFYAICEEGISSHTREFAEATIRLMAYDAMYKNIGALVLTAVEIIQNKEVLSRIKEEFKKEIF